MEKTLLFDDQTIRRKDMYGDKLYYIDGKTVHDLKINMGRNFFSLMEQLFVIKTSMEKSFILLMVRIYTVKTSMAKNFFGLNLFPINGLLYAL